MIWAAVLWGQRGYRRWLRLTKATEIRMDAWCLSIAPEHRSVPFWPTEMIDSTTGSL